MSETWWIVGASEGLGRALAERFDKAGARLILSARSAERLTELGVSLSDAAPLPLDVTDGAAVAEAAGNLGPIDGLVYSVGLYQPMAATEWDTEAAVAMTEANYLGALRVIGAALPGMRARGAGRIVLIGSIAGFRGLPGSIGYGASKAAIIHLAENLRADLGGTGIEVQVINPGFIDTRLTRKNDFRMPMIMQPEDAADRTFRAINGGRFSTSFPAPFSTLFKVGRCLPIGLFQRLFRT